MVDRRFTRAGVRQIAVLAVAVAVVAWLCVALLRPPEGTIRDEIQARGEAAHCAPCVVRDQSPAEYFRAILRADARRAGASDAALETIVEYLDAASRACGSNMADLRLRGGNVIDPAVLNRAADWTAHSRSAPPPPDPDSASDRELIEWWVAIAQPWAWVDRRSLRFERVALDAFATHHARHAERVAAANRESTMFAMSAFRSPFTRPDNRPLRDGARAFRCTVTFSLRFHPPGPESWSVSIYVVDEGDGAVGVLGVVLENVAPAAPRNFVL